MENNIAGKSCVEFANDLSSKAPVPGGGGASALSGALSAALCSMAGNLTLGKKKYADLEPQVKSLVSEADALRARFLDLIDKDARAFEPLSEAYSLPKDAENYSEIMRTAVLNACAAPFEIMQCCCRAIELIGDMLNVCSKLMISDVGCGAALAAAALEASAMNVFVNTKLLPDDPKAAEFAAGAKKMLEEYLPLAKSVSDKVLHSLSGGAV